MARANQLQRLADDLDLSVGVLRGIAKGEGRKEEDIVRQSAARALGQIALWAGYPTKQRAEKEIAKLARTNYITSDVLLKRLDKFMTANAEKPFANLPPFRLARAALVAENMTLFVELYRRYWKILRLPFLYMPFSEANVKNDMDHDMLDRAAASMRGKGASRRPFEGVQRIIGLKAFLKGLRARAKRWGSVSSLYWQAALELNPKVKQPGLAAARKKAHPHPQGAIVKTQKTRDGWIIEVEHHADKENPRFYKKMEGIIRDSVKYWSDMAGKQIVASKKLGKLLS